MGKVNCTYPVLLLSLLAILTGAIFKIQHWPGASLLLSTGLLIGSIYIILALIDIYKTQGKSLIEKFLWLIGLIMFPLLGGLIYYLSEFSPKYKLK